MSLIRRSRSRSVARAGWSVQNGRTASWQARARARAHRDRAATSWARKARFRRRAGRHRHRYRRPDALLSTREYTKTLINAWSFKTIAEHQITLLLFVFFLSYPAGTNEPGTIHHSVGRWKRIFNGEKNAVMSHNARKRTENRRYCTKDVFFQNGKLNIAPGRSFASTFQVEHTLTNHIPYQTTKGKKKFLLLQIKSFPSQSWRMSRQLAPSRTNELRAQRPDRSRTMFTSRESWLWPKTNLNDISWSTRHMCDIGAWGKGASAHPGGKDQPPGLAWPRQKCHEVRTGSPLPGRDSGPRSVELRCYLEDRLSFHITHMIIELMRVCGHSGLRISPSNCTYTPDHLLLDSAPNIGPLISRWELDKLKNCCFRTSKIPTL